MELEIEHIDSGNKFDFGRTSLEYAKYRDIYPKSLYQKLLQFDIGLKKQTILDLGTGTGVIPRNMYEHGAFFIGTDISKNQIDEAGRLSQGKMIEYKVSPAERTGFRNSSFDIVLACQSFHYFNISTFVPELIRILKPNGRFCKIDMNWLPYEDEVVAAMESLVKKYNPKWTGGGFEEFDHSFPKWAEGKFEIKIVHTYKEYLSFCVDSWCGRVRTCRGVGASLSKTDIDAFDKEHRELLSKLTNDGLLIKHAINIEIFRLCDKIK